MKLTDLTHGRQCTIQVAVDGSAPLDGLTGKPVRAFQPPDSMDVLLAAGSGTWAIRGLTAADQGDLNRVLERGRPRVAWIAAAIPNLDHALILQIHEFAAEYVWTEPVQLGVDDALLESLRRSKMIGVRSSILDALRKLEEWFLFASAEGLPSVATVSTVGHGRRRVEDGVFSMHGRAHTADVKRDPEGRLRIERVTRLRRSAGAESGPLQAHARGAVVR